MLLLPALFRALLFMMFLIHVNLFKQFIVSMSICRGGLVGYDAALTQLRSGVRFPSTVLVLFASRRISMYSVFYYF
jgi:hypothetical protein